MNFIHNYINKIATQFSRADFMLDGKEDDQHFGPLQIKFQDGSYLTFDENGDAETIYALVEPIEFEDKNNPNIENWSEIVLNWTKLINSRLIQFKVLQSIENKIVGCKLYFEKEKAITYYNYYDDAKVAFENDKLLESYIEFEKLEWVSLPKFN
ncbi:hypothetical protein [Flavobacterium chungangense]|nr:hypothetical protein [Flavobacterium chungangense]